MWFIFAVLCLLMWSGSDLFSKIGCADRQDKEGPLKMVVAVGLVMGLHASYTLFVEKIDFSWDIILRYLPVSLLYITSMTIGYYGLRYIELSISSPICNASGAVVLLIYIAQGGRPNAPEWLALALIVFGVIFLGIVEYQEDPERRALRQEGGSFTYEKSLLAILLPLLYMLIDALGTYADSLILQELEEKAANTAYELTFLALGTLIFLYLLLSGSLRLHRKKDGAKLIAATFETAGQFAYVFALAANPMYAAPLISSYCVVSVIWSRLFLQEKLSLRHYLAIGSTLAGIIILGILEGLSA